MIRGAFFLLALNGCSLYVDGQLRDASKAIGDGAGEGEGEGQGGEGEGAAGEGEGDDPACEDRERLVVVTSDPESPLQVYKLVAGGLVPLSPTGFVPPDGKLVKENGTDLADTVQGAVFSKDDGRIFLVDGNRYYSVDASTLVQVAVRTPETAVLANSFPSFHGVAVTARYVIGAGNGLLGLDRQGGVADPPVALQSAGSFHSAIAFAKDSVTYVAANSERGYQVLETVDPAGQPSAASGADDDTRFGNFGGAQSRRGLAFDSVTGSLLLGDDDGVIVPKSPGFALPPATDDYVLPHGSFVTALGARGGKGYVANESGDVYEVDLTTTPATTVEVSSWDTIATAGIPQPFVVGCKRAFLVVGGFGGPTIFAYDRDTLAPSGGGPEVHNIIDAFLVNKADLALVGDP